MTSASPVQLSEELRQAASAGQADKVLELCKAGAKMDPDPEGRTALHLAAANGHLTSVKSLLEAGANINARDAAGYSPLHQAATEGHEEVVALLLKNGCHVDSQDELHGNTALHEAAWKGYSRTVGTLCKQRANVYIKNNGGFTPLHLTCQNGHNQCCRDLLLAGCKPDVRNSYGDTPLHTAARYGHAGVLRILISAFCSVSETNKNGDSALHISAAMGRRKLTKILMEAECDQKLKNNQQETARDIAQRKGFHEVVDILDNPPLTFIPVIETEKPQQKSEKEKLSKKREKDSNTSQESSTKEKKDKRKKTKKEQKVHFSPENNKKGNTSPYGCHLYPNLEFFPSIKMKSLPPEPLQKGEQYYADLAGNIKKGPRGLGYMCYCAPFFNHVEKKLDANKNELLKHIDHKSEDLKAKITHLEQRTHDQLFSLNQRMKESLAFERVDCSERMDRRLLRERLELQNRQETSMQSLRSEMKNWMHSGNRHINAYGAPNRTTNGHAQHDGFHLTRSKSEDLLSESGSHQWSTDIASSKMNGRSTNHSGSNTDAKHRFYTNGDNHGARPKYTVPQSSIMAKLKSKYYGNPSLSRDSRSEGDLTSCYTEATEQSSANKRGPITANKQNETPMLRVVEPSQHFIPKFQPNYSQNENVNYYKPPISSSGNLWSCYGAANKSTRTGTHSHIAPNNINTHVKHIDNNSNHVLNKYRTNDVSATVENGNAFSPITSYGQLSPKGCDRVPANQIHRTPISQPISNKTFHKEPEIVNPPTEPDGSSFV